MTADRTGAHPARHGTDRIGRAVDGVIDDVAAAIGPIKPRLRGWIHTVTAPVAGSSTTPGVEAGLVTRIATWPRLVT